LGTTRNAIPAEVDSPGSWQLTQAQAPRRPQTPRPPFPYQVQEVTFENTADGVSLAGTLTIPEGEEQFPAAILISGSGPQDRDETILDHKPFAVLADHLTRHGMAVLRYDDRGVGGSTGRFDAATSEDFARDAEAGFDFLRRHASIDPARVGLIGHSEGGLIAPIVAARRPEVAWIALLAGTGVNGREILLSQGERVLRAEGIVKDDDLQLQRAAQEGLLDAVIGSDAEVDEQQLVQRATELVRTESFGRAISRQETGSRHPTGDPAVDDALVPLFSDF
jgi:alpha/beta superfamily hydrolase